MKKISFFLSTIAILLFLNSCTKVEYVDVPGETIIVTQTVTETETETETIIETVYSDGATIAVEKMVDVIGPNETVVALEIRLSGANLYEYDDLRLRLLTPSGSFGEIASLIEVKEKNNRLNFYEPYADLTDDYDDMHCHATNDYFFDGTIHVFQVVINTTNFNGSHQISIDHLRFSIEKNIDNMEYWIEYHERDPFTIFFQS